MTDCPCCSHQMLRHIRHQDVYWFCRHCWQEMPVYELHRKSLSTSGNLVTIASIKKQLSSLGGKLNV